MRKWRFCSLGTGNSSFFISHTALQRWGFERIRVYCTPSGPGIVKFNEHLERLLYSAGVIGMQVSYDTASLSDIIWSLIDKSQLDSGYIRPFFTMEIIKWLYHRLVNQLI